MGGAECHDVWNGIQDPADPNFQANCLRLQMMDEFYRVKGESWWPQELPTEAEYEEGWRNLQTHGMCVDCVISHCAPQSIQKELFGRQYPENSLTDYLQQVSEKVKFGAWYFGHYHTNIKTGKYELIHKEFRKL